MSDEGTSVITETHPVSKRLIVLSGFISAAVYAALSHLSGSAVYQTIIGLFIYAAIALFIYIIRNSFAISATVSFTPLSLLLSYLAFVLTGEWNSFFILYAYLIFSGIVYAYSDIRKIYQMIVVNVLHALVFFINAASKFSLPMLPLQAIWAVTMFGILFFYYLIRIKLNSLDIAHNDQAVLRSLMNATTNYTVIVDEQGKVLYTSRTFIYLTKYKDPNLIVGRYIIDLFTVRELKLLAGIILAQKSRYTTDWEFVLNGQKRFFRVSANLLAGPSQDILIVMNDLTFLAERDEIAAMKDSMKIGLFFMNRDFIIQENYSRYLEIMLAEKDLVGKSFPDLLSGSVTARELGSVKDYFQMILDGSMDKETLDDINPLNEFEYFCTATNEKKIFQCGFATVEWAHGEVFILVTIYDITARVELQNRLKEEESKRQAEMQSIFELINVDPDVFNDFLEDAEAEFDRVDTALKNSSLERSEVLIDVYQSIHAIKSNAVILGLNAFGAKVHNVESRIKRMRDMEGEIPFAEMLNLTMEIEKLAQEKEMFRTNINRIRSFSAGDTSDMKKIREIFEESLTIAAQKAAGTSKKVRFIIDEISDQIIESGLRRIIKEILIQLIRNAVYHGIETPEERIAKGKKETGVVRLAILINGSNAIVRLTDDGRGLNYEKILARAKEMNLIKGNEAGKDFLMKTIFAPGFSTAQEADMTAGRGIGLNLVRDRVRSVKGSINLKTEADRGTIFNITIPMQGNIGNVL